MTYRDFKPANILIGLPNDSHTIYLVDFGLATKCMNDSYNMNSNNNLDSKFVIGTIVYAILNS